MAADRLSGGRLDRPHRMEAMLGTGDRAAAIADPSPEWWPTLKLAPGAEVCGPTRCSQLTGSYRNAERASRRAVDRALEAAPSSARSRSADRAERSQAWWRRHAVDRLLAVDLSYRFTEGMSRIRELVAGGELGKVYAVDLVFHNAYGPDKAWFYDPALSGGGCVMDLAFTSSTWRCGRWAFRRLRLRAAH
jgi:hypothetical protein